MTSRERREGKYENRKVTGCSFGLAGKMWRMKRKEISASSEVLA